MAGHSKWANIKHRKGRQDAQRAKVFTRIGKELTIAAKLGGGDIGFNPRLRLAVDKAKAANMPNDTIDRGIKKAAGDLGNVNYKYITYEGYGPSGIAIIVNALTDNANRTASNVRSAFTKGGGSIGTPGCVSFMFDEKGQILVDKEECDKSADDLMELALDAGAEDFSDDEDSYEIITAPADFDKVEKAIKDAGIETVSAEVTMIPQNYVTVTEDSARAGITRILDMLDEDDDVQSVYNNWDDGE